MRERVLRAIKKWQVFEIFNNFPYWPLQPLINYTTFPMVRSTILKPPTSAR